MPSQAFDASGGTTAIDKLPNVDAIHTASPLFNQVRDRPFLPAQKIALSEFENGLIASGVLPSVDFADRGDVQLKTAFAVSDGGTTGGGAGKPKWIPPSEAEFANAEDGHAVDPINIYVHGTFDELHKALEDAGWSEASDNPIDWLRNKDSFAVTSLYYTGADGQPHSQVAAFSRGTTGAFNQNRAHLRIFDTGKVDDEGRAVWAIAASFDNGLRNNEGWNKLKPWQWAHTKEENTDNARKYVLRTLNDSDYGGHESEFILPYTARPSTSDDKIVADITFGSGPKIIGPPPSPDDPLLA